MRIRTWAIGLFLILGFGFFTAILFVIGNRHNVFGKHVDFYSDFSDIGGLPSGAEVRVAGLEVGEVKGVEIPASPAAKFRLKLQVDTKARGLVRTDSVVSLKTEGVVGSMYVSIQEGTSNAPEAPDGATLPSKEPFDIQAVLEKGASLLNNVNGTVDDVRGRLDVTLDSTNRAVNHVNGLITVLQPDIRRMVANASHITGTLNGIVADLNEGKGPAGLFLKDEATRRQLQATVSNVQQATLNLKDTAARADQLVADVQSRDLASKVQVTLENVQAISQRLNDTIKAALASDDMGDDGATNLRQTLSNLNRGTANLADDTESLKHEFFFRGFFKKRGFYNLEQLTPVDYLKACENHKSCESRTWLDATDLFADDNDGKEELVESGRRQIDTAVSPFVDSLPNHIVIIEGYCAAGTPDKEYVISRRRADLVREYLETHFHLIHTDLGIVPLRKPPRGAKRKAWNGVAIVLFEEG